MGLSTCIWNITLLCILWTGICHAAILQFAAQEDHEGLMDTDDVRESSGEDDPLSRYQVRHFMVQLFSHFP